MTDEISNQERRLQQMDLKLSSVFYSIQHSTVKNQALNTWGGESGLLRQFSGISSTLNAFSSLITKGHGEMNLVPNEQIYVSPLTVPDMLSTSYTPEVQANMDKLIKEQPKFFEHTTENDNSTFLDEVRNYDAVLADIFHELSNHPRDPKKSRFYHQNTNLVSGINLQTLPSHHPNFQPNMKPGINPLTSYTPGNPMNVRSPSSPSNIPGAASTTPASFVRGIAPASTVDGSKDGVDPHAFERISGMLFRLSSGVDLTKQPLLGGDNSAQKGNVAGVGKK